MKTIAQKIINDKRSSGFTIVEITTVVVVIGILVSVVVFGFNGWKRSTTINQIKSDLLGAAQAMEHARSFGTGYPSTLPSTFSPSSGVTLAGGGTSDGLRFCIQASSIELSEVIYHISSDEGSPQEGDCRGIFIAGWTQASAGRYMSCGVGNNGAAYCWGYNNIGQLGDSSTTNAATPITVYTGSILGSKNILSIVTGDYQTCVLASDNKAYCWGRNNYGQLGNNSTTDSLVPVAVNMSGALSGKTIKSISSGANHTCVIASDDKAYCWGYNYYGQLGSNDTNDSLVPVPVYSLDILNGKTVKSISVGQYHTCAIASDDKAYCWGRNTNGQLGNNSVTSSSVPVAVNTAGALGGKTIKVITSGHSYHTCVIASDDKAYCWGQNTYGKLGNNSTNQSLVPVAVYTAGVLSGKSLTQISAGQDHTCALASDDQIYCWGSNNYGELGNSSVTGSSPIPVVVIRP